MDQKELRQFLDEEGRLAAWPAKPKKQLAALISIADKLEWNRDYSEKEVNELLNRFHTFNDPALLRRELYMKHFVDRKPDGSAYWKTPRLLPKEWKSERLMIRDAVEGEIAELQKIYDECAYIGELTGYHDNREHPMLAEFQHETLPPKGRKEFHRLQSILERKTNALIGYVISYHGFPDPLTFWIAVLAIRPTFQRQKFGREVMDALEKQLSMLGTYQRMGISIGIGNDPAMKFWSSCGFDEVVKTENHGKHSDQWIVKNLKNESNNDTIPT